MVLTGGCFGWLHLWGELSLVTGARIAGWACSGCATESRLGLALSGTRLAEHVGDRAPYVTKRRGGEHRGSAREEHQRCRVERKLGLVHRDPLAAPKEKVRGAERCSPKRTPQWLPSWWGDGSSGRRRGAEFGANATSRWHGVRRRREIDRRERGRVRSLVLASRFREPRREGSMGRSGRSWRLGSGWTVRCGGGVTGADVDR